VTPAARAAGLKAKADPLFFIRHVLGGTLTPDQVRVCESVRDNRRTAAPAGHAVGKSYVASCLVLWFLGTRPGSKVITTAPTWRQVEEVLWREIAVAHARSLQPFGGRMMATQLEMGPEWFAIGISTDDPTRFQGIHAPEMLLIFDEATGVDREIWDAGEALAVGPNDRFLAIGNPTDPTSRFKQVCDSGKWNVVEISVENHPNVLEGRQIIPGAPSREWVAERLEDYGGRESPLYRARVLGRWPDAGDDVLIPLALVESAQARWQEAQGRPQAAGCDVARFGADETVVATIDGAGNVAPLIIRRGQDLMATAGHLRFINARRTMVDDTGLGGGVTDRLREQSFHVEPVNFGEAAEEPERFTNRRAELWWTLREALKAGRLGLPDDRRLAADLTNVKYGFDSKGRIKLEAKDDLRKRLGRSPDRGDALALAAAAFAPARAAISDLDIEIGMRVNGADLDYGFRRGVL